MRAAISHSLYWLDHVDKSYSPIVGKKSANLGELARAGFRFPQGFALSVEVYDQFMKRTGAGEDIDRFLKHRFTTVPLGGGSKANEANYAVDIAKYEEVSTGLRRIVESRKMPADLVDVIARYYQALCKKTGVDKVPVAVRSSAPISRPGQYETYLFTRGLDDVLQAIIKVFSSTFNTPSLLMRHKAGLPMNRDPIGVAVVQMVHAKAAGVAFTLNPVNGDRSKIIIEGNWGFGESVVGGFVTPDEWEFDKVLLEVTTRKIADKQVEYAMDPQSKKVIRSAIPLERQAAPCLTDEEVLELARVSKAIEKHFGIPQDIEWVIDQDLPFPDNLFFVQARPESIWNGRKAEPKLKTTGCPTRDVIHFYQNLKA